MNGNSTIIRLNNEAAEREANEATNGHGHEAGSPCDHVICNELRTAANGLDPVLQLLISCETDPHASMAMILYAIGATDPDLARSALIEIGEKDPLNGLAIVANLNELADLSNS